MRDVGQHQHQLVQLERVQRIVGAGTQLQHLCEAEQLVPRLHLLPRVGALVRRTRMTPERLDFLIRSCFAHRNKKDLTTHYADIAAFLHIEPHTLRRWLSGERPIPRMAELLMEAFHAWPDTVNAATLSRVIDERDRT